MDLGIRISENSRIGAALICGWYRVPEIWNPKVNMESGSQPQKNSAGSHIHGVCTVRDYINSHPVSPGLKMEEVTYETLQLTNIYSLRPNKPNIIITQLL